MISYCVGLWRTLPGLTGNHIWERAFRWLESDAPLQPDGFHQLGADGFYARIMRYPLNERAMAAFENHRHTIDIQYTVAGAETIEFAELPDLNPKGEYSREKDTEFFETPLHSFATIDNSEGRFVIIFPGEPHMPQLMTPNSKEVHKVVIKIPEILLLKQPAAST